MLISVDGTGCTGMPGTRARQYAKEMAGSFVRRVHNGSSQRNRKYHEGPDLTGIAYMVSTATLFQQVEDFWRGGDRQIFLVGYSRGGAVVIDLAYMLTYRALADGRKAEIDAMFLFDAVNRTIQMASNQKIPPNVKVCYHAKRSPNAYSRGFFGNCGTEYDKKTTKWADRAFMTTHGGMGGVLWGEKGVKTEVTNLPPLTSVPMGLSWGGTPRPPHDPPYISEGYPFGETNVTVAQEKAGSAEVWAWMKNFLGRHGVV